MRPSGRGHWRTAIAVTLLLFVDGFDLFLIGKIAPAIAAGFGRAPAAMGLVFTCHQIGLALGAFVVPVVADRFGSKRLLIATAMMFGIGNIASAFATDFYTFALVRGVCGFFMAGAMPVGLALLSENIPQRRLGAILSLAMVGMSVGAAANSIVPAWLLDPFGWQSGFILGGAMPLLLLPLLTRFIPESARFLNKQTKARPALGGQLAAVFADRRAVMTLLLWSTVFVSMGQTAMIAAWLPTIFQEIAGIRIQDFAVVATLTAVGGALGTVASGWLQDRYGAFLVTALAHTAQGVGLILLGIVPFGTALFAMTFVSWSFFQSASIVGINLLLVRLYPVEIRATGSGWAAGMGRIGGTLAPAAGSLILVGGLGLPAAMTWIALPAIVIAAAIIPLLAWSNRTAACRDAADAARHRVGDASTERDGGQVAA